MAIFPHQYQDYVALHQGADQRSSAASSSATNFCLEGSTSQAEDGISFIFCICFNTYLQRENSTKSLFFFLCMASMRYRFLFVTISMSSASWCWLSSSSSIPSSSPWTTLEMLGIDKRKELYRRKASFFLFTCIMFYVCHEYWISEMLQIVKFLTQLIRALQCSGFIEKGVYFCTNDQMRGNELAAICHWYRMV